MEAPVMQYGRGITHLQIIDDLLTQSFQVA
eukprot:SAG31_NODE_36759_length_310_cov_1.213270_1_plen_29_part_01